jgi:hypothetical protein
VSDKPTGAYLSAARGVLYRWMRANPNATEAEKRAMADKLGLK